MMNTHGFPVGALVTAALMAAATTASATGRSAGYNGLRDGYVVAESKFNHGEVSGPVRRVAVGLQVRLPGGTWVDCRRSCSETLRVETVDFWEKQQGITDECGVFGCLEVGIPLRRYR